MFLEYDWAFDVYRPRVGRDTFTPIRGFHSFANLREAREILAQCGLQLGRKTDSRTWKIELQERFRNSAHAA